MGSGPYRKPDFRPRPIWDLGGPPGGRLIPGVILLLIAGAIAAAVDFIRSFF